MMDAALQRFLGDPSTAAATVMAEELRPPLPVDLEAWAVEHVTFGPESPFPGPYDVKRFPFFSRILEVLSPDHPARVVVFRKSAQLGGTVLAQIFVGGCLALVPGPMLYTHPTDGNAARWSKTKWGVMVRQTPALRKVFGAARSRDTANSTLYQERRDGRGYLLISGANSPAQLSMVSVPRQVQDDLSKWELNNAGDPEDQADSRSKAFARAKIFKIGTPLLEQTCKITRAFDNSTQEHFHLPCPHCEHFQPLDWDNMLANLDEEKPDDAHFTCTSCGAVIEHKHKHWMVSRGRWVAHNPGAHDVGFYLWAAYSPLESWASIARAWLRAQGDPAKEQTFLNDYVGRAYRQEGEAPKWEAIRARAEASGHQLGRIPPGALLITAGVDCQVDRVEVHVKGFGRDLKRWTIDYRVIEGHISEERCRAALDELLRETWPDAFGNARGIEQLAIDAGYAKVDVFDWARKHPREKVMCVRGAHGNNAADLSVGRPELVTVGGRRIRSGIKIWWVGVSPLKASFYKHLHKEDPMERGFCAYPTGLDEDFYRQLTAERWVQVRLRTGYIDYRWTKDAGQANEVLDTEIYAEAAAIRLGWKRLTDEQWDREQAERERPNDAPQLDLLDPDRSARPAQAAKPVAVAEPEPQPVVDAGENWV